MQQREIVVRFALPSDEQGTETVVPGIGTFDDPASRFPADTSDERRLTAAANVRDDPTDANFNLSVQVVVALVQTQVLGASWTTRCSNDDRVEHIGDEPFVVHVRCRDAHRYRHASPVGQDVSLHPAFRTVRRVGTSVVPPFGALTVALSSEVHAHWMPRRSS